ncbi:MAG: cytochrome b/b6 domain-containing protein [Bryobacterales bacterium]
MERSDVEGAPALRHARAVRITHWLNVVTFVALTLSGIAILTAHPRFYWGETGFFNTPAAFELPFDPILEELYVRAWGRQVHFLAAWIAVLNGLVYVGWGLYAGHFRFQFVPHGRQLQWKSITELVGRHLRLQNPVEKSGYNLFQKLAYSAVVFGLLPLVILSGLTMSPGVTAAFPQLFTLFGGRQSARTIHFILAILLVVFVAVHVFMSFLAGFRRNVVPMITGGYRGQMKEDK